MRLVKVDHLLERGLGKARSMEIPAAGLYPRLFVTVIVGGIHGEVQWDAARAAKTWIDGREWPEWF